MNIIKKQLDRYFEKEDMCVLNKRERDDIKFSSISLESLAEGLEMQFNAFEEAIKDGEDPMFWLISMKVQIQSMKRYAKVIDNLIP